MRRGAIKELPIASCRIRKIMRVLIQRVKHVCVTVQGREVARIGEGLLIFAGIGTNDGNDDVEYLSNKITNLRIFEDEMRKMNLNVQQVNGSVLSVSQFTLYADTMKGNRPGFDRSADPATAKELWSRLNDSMRRSNIDVQEGIFGADMEVELINDGPVTIWMDSERGRKGRSQ